MHNLKDTNEVWHPSQIIHSNKGCKYLYCSVCCSLAAGLYRLQEWPALMCIISDCHCLDTKCTQDFIPNYWLLIAHGWGGVYLIYGTDGVHMHVRCLVWPD